MFSGVPLVSWKALVGRRCGIYQIWGVNIVPEERSVRSRI